MGILIFYPLPIMRWPITLAKILGDVTAEYRWFAAVYLALMFVAAPLLIFILSLAGPVVLYSVLGPFMLLCLVVSVINVIQTHRSQWLPYFLRDWTFLPIWMHSLRPLDDLFSRMACCAKCINPEPEHFQDEQLYRDVESAMNKSYAEEMQVLVKKKPPAIQPISMQRQEA